MELADQSSFSLRSTVQFDHRYVRPDGSIAYTNYAAPKQSYDPQDLLIELYHSNSSPCSPDITGASETKELPTPNGKTTWGKVDAFDRPNPDFPPGTQPLCRPPILKWDYDEAKGGVLRLSNDAAYVLCSEKDGKRVLICISQITDNPALAEQIFMTFRWTD
ncbi:MAG: hypothetical protein PHN33_00790 [Candidatus Peribacteraceae bacterium]|nr:hypothetical protein [Candidatus Peribacteraceae bacterium]